MAAIGIISTGTANKRVAADGLSSLLEQHGDDGDFWFAISPEKKPSPGLQEVYEWLVDSEVYYVLVLPEGASTRGFPSDLVKNANETLTAEGDTDEFIVDLVKSTKKEPNKVILVMWDDDNQGQEDVIATACDAGLRVLDLSSGLEVIEVDSGEDAAPEPEPEPEPAPRSRRSTAKKDEEPAEEKPKATRGRGRAKAEETEPGGAYTREELDDKKTVELRALALAHGWSAADDGRDEIIDKLLLEKELPKQEPIDTTPPPSVTRSRTAKAAPATNGDAGALGALVLIILPNGGVHQFSVGLDTAREITSGDLTALRQPVS